jgi:hypothetical protein
MLPLITIVLKASTIELAGLPLKFMLTNGLSYFQDALERFLGSVALRYAIINDQ